MNLAALTSLLIPLCLGMIGILQGGLNRQIANSIGVAQATLISNFVTVLICISFYLIVKTWPAFFPEFFKVKAPLTTYQWWYIFPAIFGFMIVAGLPYAISEIGAVKVTILLIVAQMMTSVLWDIFVEKIPMTTMKTLGMIAAMVSVALITLSK